MYNEVLSTVVGCWPLMKSISTLRAGLDATVCTLQMRVECSRCIDAANSARCRCSAGITIDRMPPERSKRAAPAVSDSRFSEPSWRAVSLCRSGACAPLVKKHHLQIFAPRRCRKVISALLGCIRIAFYSDDSSFREPLCQHEGYQTSTCADIHYA